MFTPVHSPVVRRTYNYGCESYNNPNELPWVLIIVGLVFIICILYFFWVDSKE
jgi:hypothetical protein